MENDTKVVSFSIKGRDVVGLDVVTMAKSLVREKGLPSFSYIVIVALTEYLEKHYGANRGKETD